MSCRIDKGLTAAVGIVTDTALTSPTMSPHVPGTIMNRVIDMVQESSAQAEPKQQEVVLTGASGAMENGVAMLLKEKVIDVQITFNYSYGSLVVQSHSMSTTTVHTVRVRVWEC